MPTYDKIGERDLEFITLYILNESPNITTSELKQQIWHYTEPDGVNLIDLVHRNDKVIDQIVRNIISHRHDSPNNIIYRGLVTYNDGILNITAAGRDELDRFIKKKAL